jgi:hypothetical protein
MRVLLKVGYNTYLLPNDSGLPSVIKALSAALHCYDHTYRTADKHIQADPEPLEVSVKYLPTNTKIRFKGSYEEEPVEQLRLVAPTSIIIPPSGK